MLGVVAISALIGLLRGDGESGERAQGSPVFGRLGFRSESALGKLIDVLINENAVAENTLSHGGVALGITPHGRKILHTDESLAHLVSAPTPVPLSNSTSSSLVAIPPDSQNGVLLTKLQNWRNDLARTQEVPPYVIASNAVLQEIATLRPTSLEQLGRIKGIGPAKLAQYGAAILEVIQQTAVKA